MSEELFYLSNGKKKDEALHNDILEDKPANIFTKLQSFHSSVIDDNLEPAFALEFFELEPKDLNTRENETIIKSRAGRGLKSYSMSV